MTTEEIHAAALSLGEHLRDLGVRGPVGISHQKSGPVLMFYAERKKDEKACPKEWESLMVLTEVIGKIRPATAG